MRVLGVIPARGGSKGIPGKNIKLLAGKPLLQYTADAASAARRLTHVMLTTDDERIAQVGRACGVDVPFLRPAELSADDTPTLPVVQHAVKWYEAQGTTFDAVCLLQPTTPFRRQEDIDSCIKLLDDTGADAVVTILPVPADYNPHWVYFRVGSELRLSTGEAAPLPRRQDLPPAFHREGSVYVTRRDVLMERNSLYGTRVVGFEIKDRPSVNLDLPEDWIEAERLVQTRQR